MSQPTVAVIITNYNYARYLRSVVESVQEQRPDELIVVDDGSTDGSREIIAELAGIVPVLKPNGGHVSAVNAGYAASVSDVVIFLDADDRLSPDCLSAIRGAWTEKVSKIQWGMRYIDANGAQLDKVFPTFTSRHTPEWCRQQMEKQCCYDAPPTSGNAWSRSMLEKLMPLPRLGSKMWALDDYLHLLAPYLGDVISLPLVLGEYRVHSGQMSGTFTFSAERHANMTGDEILRYAAVNSVLASLGGPRLDPLRWSIHTLNRIFMRRLGLSQESILPLLWRHVTAAMQSDRRLLSKGKIIATALAVAMAGRALTHQLARLTYQR